MLKLVSRTSISPKDARLLLIPQRATGKTGLHTLLSQASLPEFFRSGEHPAIKGDRGAKLVLHGESTLMIMGIGPVGQFNAQESAEWGEHAARSLSREHAGPVLQVLFPDELSDRDVVLGFLKGMAMVGHRNDEFKSAPVSPSARSEVREIRFAGKAASRIRPTDLEFTSAVVAGIAFARELVELPPASGSPEGITERFDRVRDRKLLKLEIWDESKIKSKKMGLLEAVSRGSEMPPRFLIARTGSPKNAKAKTLCLVGKGVTFDTGGVNLKTGAWQELLWMKKDMGGAAAVLGAMLAISRLKPSLNVIGITPLTTNSIGSKAVLPGDIVTSYAGKTVEIQNTDAEGRLILADALHQAKLEKADYIVDVATLTGACQVALGAYHSGLFSNNDLFQERVRKLSVAAGEPAWPMPMSRRYGDELKSRLADLSNMGKDRMGGATLGAKFLENFVGETPWCHLDIAGTVDLGEPASALAQTSAAGRMVDTLTRLALTI